MKAAEQAQVGAALRLAGLTLQGGKAAFDKAFLKILDERLAKLAPGVASLPLLRNLRDIVAQALAQGKSFEIRVANDMDVKLPALAENVVIYLNAKHLGRIAGRNSPFQSATRIQKCFSRPVSRTSTIPDRFISPSTCWTVRLW